MKKEDIDQLLKTLTTEEVIDKLSRDLRERLISLIEANGQLPKN